MHRFYYNSNIQNDVLFCLINPNKCVDKAIKNNDIVTLYSSDEIVGYNFFNISNEIILPHSGAFFKKEEDEKILAVVNKLLSKNNLNEITKNISSGYLVAEVLSNEEHPLLQKSSIINLSTGEKNVQTVTSFSNLKVGDKVVIKTNNCLDNEGKLFLSHVEKNIQLDVEIVNAYELGLSDKFDNEAFLVNNKEIGCDFFNN